MVTYSFFIKITPLYAKSDEREFDDLEVLFDKEILPSKSIKFPKEIDDKLAKDLNFLKFESFHSGDSSRISLTFKEELTEVERGKLIEFLTNIIENKDNQIIFDNLSYSVKPTNLLYDWK